MLKIIKSEPPKGLAALERERKRVVRESGKPTTSKDWQPGAHYDFMREALCHDQGWLCAYCQRKLAPHSPVGNATIKVMKIEHLAVRSKAPSRMFEWNNLIGCCVGVLGDETTCDTARRDANIHHSPLDQRSLRQWCFRLEYDGKLTGDCEHADHDIRILNLNHPQLVESRQMELQSFRDFASKQRRSDEKFRRILQRMLDVRGNRPLPEFAQLIARRYLHVVELEGTPPGSR